MWIPNNRKGFTEINKVLSLEVKFIFFSSFFFINLSFKGDLTVSEIRGEGGYENGFNKFMGQQLLQSKCHMLCCAFQFITNMCLICVAQSQKSGRGSTVSLNEFQTRLWSVLHEQKNLLTPPTKSQMIKRGVKRLQWSTHKGINMESCNDLKGKVWTNNTSKVVITSQMHGGWPHTPPVGPFKLAVLSSILSYSSLTSQVSLFYTCSSPFWKPLGFFSGGFSAGDCPVGCLYLATVP